MPITVDEEIWINHPLPFVPLLPVKVWLGDDPNQLPQLRYDDDFWQNPLMVTKGLVPVGLQLWTLDTADQLPQLGFDDADSVWATYALRPITGSPYRQIYSITGTDDLSPAGSGTGPVVGRPARFGFSFRHFR
jgi:hypothetical protein